MNNPAIASVQMTFSIRECECKSFKFTEFALSNTTAIPFDKYLFNFSIAINIRAEEKIIAIDLGANLLGNSDIKDEIAILESQHHFYIVNFSEISIKREDGKIEINEQLLIPLLSISLSNMRGMFAVKLEDSLYANAIIPVLDVSQWLPKRNINLG